MSLDMIDIIPWPIIHIIKLSQSSLIAEACYISYLYDKIVDFMFLYLILWFRIMIDIFLNINFNIKSKNIYYLTNQVHFF